MGVGKGESKIRSYNRLPLAFALNLSHCNLQVWLLFSTPETIATLVKVLLN